MQDELPAVDGAAQLADQRQALAAVPIARREVDLVAGARPLGRVHRHVGALQETERVAGMLGVQRDADAGVDVHAHALHREGPFERRPQAQAGDARRRLVTRLEHERELVAT